MAIQPAHIRYEISSALHGEDNSQLKYNPQRGVMSMWIETTKSGKRLRDRVVVDGKTYQISVPLEKDTQQARNKAMAALEEKRRDISTPVCEKPLNDILGAYLSRDIRESTRKVP